MKIGLITPPDDVGFRSLTGLIDWARQAESDGFHSLWFVQVPVLGNDVLTAIAVIGQNTNRITLGSGVVATHPRHPLVMAQQALTVQVACGGRLQLGLGLSHQPVVEDLMGLSYSKPAQHMREYLAVLAPLVRGEEVSHQGEHYRVTGSLHVADAQPCPILVAALGPRLLELAGQLSDGTITWMAGIKTISTHICPKISHAAAALGRVPRVVASLPVVVTDQPGRVAEEIDSSLEMYGNLASYRRMLDREGVESPSGVSLIGNEADIEEQLAAFAAAGVTEFAASIPGFGTDAYHRTYEFLQTVVDEF